MWGSATAKHRHLFLKTALVAVCVILIAGSAYADWWNSAWPYKRCFSIGTSHSAVDTNYTFVASDINTSSWLDTNGLGFALVDETLLTELDLNYTGPIGSRTFKWRASHSTVADGEDSSYCLYYGNNSRVTPQKRDPKNIYAIYDDFEDGDYTTNPMWSLGVTQGGEMGIVAIQSSVVKNGGYSLLIEPPATTSTQLVYLPITRTKGTYSSWIRTNSVADAQAMAYGFKSGMSVVQAGLSIYLGSFSVLDGGVPPAFAITPSNNTWYNFELVIDTSTYAANIYNSSGTLLEGKTGLSYAGGTTDKIALSVWDNDEGVYYYFDDIKYQHTLENETEITIGQVTGINNTSLIWDGGTRNVFTNYLINWPGMDVNKSWATISSTPFGAAWDGNYVWVVEYGDLDPFTPRIMKTNLNGSILGIYNLPHANPTDALWDGSYVWIPYYDERNICKYDKSGGGFNEIACYANPPILPGKIRGMTYFHNEFWVTVENSNILYKITPIDSQVLGGEGGPCMASTGLTDDETNIYCTENDWNSQNILKYNMSTHMAEIYSFPFQHMGLEFIYVPPYVSDIPDVNMDEDNINSNIDLDGSITDVDNSDVEIRWNADGNVNIAVDINVITHVVTLTPNSNWCGAETITFTATDPKGHEGRDDSVITVNCVPDAPLVSDIPNIDMNEDTANSTIDLDNYVTDADVPYGDSIGWSYSGNANVSVSISGAKVVALNPASNWCGVETITFSATDSLGLSNSDNAIVTVNCVPDAPQVGDIPAVRMYEDNTMYGVVEVPFSINVYVDTRKGLEGLIALPNPNLGVYTADVNYDGGIGLTSGTATTSCGTQLSITGNVLTATPLTGTTMTIGNNLITYYDNANVYHEIPMAIELPATTIGSTFTFDGQTIYYIVNQGNNDADANGSSSTVDVNVANGNTINGIAVDINLHKSPTYVALTLDVNAIINGWGSGGTAYDGTKPGAVIDLNGLAATVKDINACGSSAIRTTAAGCAAGDYNKVTLQFDGNVMFRKLTSTGDIYTTTAGASAVTTTSHLTTTFYYDDMNYNGVLGPAYTANTIGLVGANDKYYRYAMMVSETYNKVYLLLSADTSFDTIQFIGTDRYEGGAIIGSIVTSGSDSAVKVNSAMIAAGTSSQPPVPVGAGVDANAVNYFYPDELEFSSSNSDNDFFVATISLNDECNVIDLDNYITDPDIPFGDTITWSSDGNAHVGVSIGADKKVGLTPDANWCGTEAITFTARDSYNWSSSDASTITVWCVNDPPTIAGLPDVAMDEDTVNSAIDLDNYVSDVDNASAEITWSATGNANVAVNIDANTHVVTLTPAANWHGSEIITFTATDPDGLSGSDDINVTVRSINDTPVANITSPVDGSIFTEGTVIIFSGSAADIENGVLSGSSIRWTSSIDGLIGTGNAFITILSPGDHTITLVATDLESATGTAAISVTVTIINTPPNLEPIPDQDAYEDAGFLNDIVDIWAYASDAQTPDENLTFTITLQGNPSIVSCVIDSGRYIDCITQPNRFGYSDVEVMVQDPQGLADMDAFRVSIAADNDAPVFSVLPAQTMLEDDADGIQNAIFEGGNPSIYAYIDTRNSEKSLITLPNSNLSGYANQVIHSGGIGLTNGTATTVCDTNLSIVGNVLTATMLDGTTTAIGDNLVKYYDTDWVYHEIPMAIELPATTTGNTFLFDGQTIYIIVNQGNNDADANATAGKVDVNLSDEQTINGIAVDMNYDKTGDMDANITINSYFLKPGSVADLNGLAYTLKDTNSCGSFATIWACGDVNKATLQFDGNVMFRKLSSTGDIYTTTLGTFSTTTSPLTTTWYYDDLNYFGVLGPAYITNPVWLRGANDKDYKYAMAISETYNKVYLLLSKDTIFDNGLNNKSIQLQGTDRFESGFIDGRGLVSSTAATKTLGSTLDIYPNPVGSGVDANAMPYFYPDELEFSASSSDNSFMVAHFDLEENCGVVFDLDSYASDIDNDPLAFSIISNSCASLVSSVAIDTNNKINIGAPLANQFGNCEVSIQVSDTNLATGTAMFTITVQAVNDAPVVSGIPEVTMYEDAQDSNIDLDNYVSDVDNAISEITWSATGNANVAVNIDAITHVVTLTPAANWYGTETITFTASDGDLNDSDSIVVTVTPVNDYPTAAITNPADGSTFTEGTAITFRGNAIDIEDGNLTGSSLVWTSSRDGAIGTGTSFIKVLSIGNHTITLSATDSNSATATDAITVNITQINTPPVLDGILDQTINEDSGLNDNIIDLWDYASDGQTLDDGLTFSINSQSNASLVNCVVDAGRYIDCTTLQQNASGSSNATAMVVDAGGLGDIDVFTVAVQPVNDFPSAVITAPASGSGFADQDNIAFSGSATDIEDGTLSSAALQWASDIDGVLGTGESVVATLSGGTHTITLTATDANGGMGIATITLNICATPRDGLVISNSMSICSGSYNVIDTAGDGAIVIDSDLVTLDCSNAYIYGDGTGKGIVVNGYIPAEWFVDEDTTKDLNIVKIAENEAAFESSLTYRQGITIRNCDVSGYGTGLAVVGGSGLAIANNGLHDNTRAGLGAQGLRDSTIAGNFAYNNSQGGIAVQAGKNNVIEWNDASFNAGTGIASAGRGDIISSNNVSNNSGGIGVLGYDYKVLNNAVAGNIGNEAAGISALYTELDDTYNTTGIEIAYNDVSGSANCIDLIDVNNVYLHDNNMQNCGTGLLARGLFQEDTVWMESSRFENNRILNSSKAGMHLTNWSFFLKGRFGMLGNEITGNYFENPGVYDLQVSLRRGAGYVANNISSNSFMGLGVNDSYAQNTYCVAGIGNTYGAEAQLAPGDCPS